MAFKTLKTKGSCPNLEMEVFEHEANIMRRLKHPNIIRLYEVIKIDNVLHIVMEWAAGGTLMAHLFIHSPHQRLYENEIKLFVRQIVDAMAYIHGKGIVHKYVILWSQD